MGRRPRSATREGVPEIDGYVVIDKPAGMTSHDVVARARRALETRRIGHAGTLDPGATGVLVLGIGRATRLLRFVSELPKSYSGEIVFGVTTTTLDNEGEATGTFTMEDLTPERVVAAAAEFVGTIEQIPPMVSAIKIDGERLYDLARQGIEVERTPRSITITRFEVTPTDEPLHYRFLVDCSSGTYVRSLVADLGEALGGGAHLRGLRRQSIGSFDLEESEELATLTREAVRPPTGLVRHLTSIVVEGELEGPITHGRVLERRSLEAVGEGPFALLSAGQDLLAIYESWTTERIKPAVVIASAPPASNGDADAGEQ